MDRLQKLIAGAGFCSRRTAEEWIRAGRVYLNGRPAQTGEVGDPAVDEILVDGKRLQPLERRIYLMLNKPAGYITTRADIHARQTVMDLLDPEVRKVFPVGRLDKETEGLLLLTSDGDLAFRLNHPRFGVEKTYRAEVHGMPSETAIRRLREGVLLDDGVTAPAGVQIIEQSQGKSVIEMTIHEGRKRQVRRMLKEVGHRVSHLERVRYGPLECGRLRRGQWRHLTAAEVEMLRKVTSPG